MSGYLRRLAASVMHPARAIHPMTGSIFAPSKSAGPFIVYDEEAAAPREATPSSLQPQADAQPASRTLNQPVVASKGEAMIVRPAPHTDSDVRLEKTEALPVGHVEPRTYKSIPQAPALPSQAVELERPLLVNGAANDRLTQRISFEFPESVPNTRTEKSTPQPSNGTNRRSERQESNDVQIHIGRIEVIAVPAPVSRPQAKPARKSPSLDEYLKRGRS